ncbi:MAG: hypothetical protein MI974_21675 [Chitinophagales bacterium]|nr:hypothetical protein [Chitinophagales bacterium]
MQGSRLLDVIYCLKKREIREIRQFLRSPFFNTRQDVIEAFDLIINYVYELKIVPTKETLCRKLFPDKATHDIQQARYIMSWLLKLIEQYLSLQSILNDTEGQQIRLANIYRERKLNKHFQQTITKVKTQYNQSNIRNAAYFDQAYQIQLEEYRYTSSQKRLSEHNLQEISDTIDLAYLARKLQQTCFLTSHQAVYQKEYDFGLLRYSLNYIEEKGLLKIPAIAVYYHCYLALTDLSSEHHFRSFKQLLLEQGNIFLADELRDLYLLAINYCIRRLNSGKEAYAAEGLELYKAGLQSNILTPGKSISRFTYRNVVAMALKVGELDWAETFIHQYRSFLEKSHQESMYSFSLARLAYRKKAYGQVLELLQKAEYEDPLLNLAAKTLLIKVYYENEELDPLLAHLDAMRTYVHRKRVIGYHRTNYLNIIRFTRRLANINPFDQAAITKLYQQMAEESILTEKEWLLEQTHSL